MAKLKDNLQRQFMPAVIVTAALLVVNYILSFLSYPVSGLYSAVGPVSAVSGTLGQKVLGWIGGIIPIGDFLGMGLLAVFISAYLILLVGNWLVDTMNFPSAKGRIGRLASVILWGAAVFYVLVVGLVLQSWGVLVGLAIHTVIVAYVAAFAADRFNVAL